MPIRRFIALTDAHHLPTCRQKENRNVIICFLFRFSAIYFSLQKFCSLFVVGGLRFSCPHLQFSLELSHLFVFFFRDLTMKLFLGIILIVVDVVGEYQT